VPKNWSEWTVENIKSSAPNALATGPFGSAISSKYFVDSGVPVLNRPGFCRGLDYWELASKAVAGCWE
jgi:hypothetical protein